MLAITVDAETMRKRVWSGGACRFPGQRKQPLDAEGKRDSADRDIISLKTGLYKKTRKSSLLKSVWVSGPENFHWAMVDLSVA